MGLEERARGPGPGGGLAGGHPGVDGLEGPPGHLADLLEGMSDRCHDTSSIAGLPAASPIARMPASGEM